MTTINNLVENLDKSSCYKAYFEEKSFRKQLTAARPRAITVIELVYNKITTVLADTAFQTIPAMSSATLKIGGMMSLGKLKDNACSSHKARYAAGKPFTGMLYET